MNDNKQMTMNRIKIVWAGLLAIEMLIIWFTYFMLSMEVETKTVEYVSPIYILISGSALFFLLAMFFPSFIKKSLKKILQDKYGACDFWLQYRNEVLAGYLVFVIFRVGFFLPITVLGSFIAKWTGDFNNSLPFAAVSLLGFLTNYPTEEKAKDSFK
jgi:hypothetical protein